MKIELTNGMGNFKYFRFVAAGTGKDKKGFCWSLVKIEKDKIVATDASKMFIAEVQHNYEPGFYEVIKNTQKQMVLLKTETDLKFPDYEKFIPTDYQRCFDYKSPWSLSRACQVSALCGHLGQVGLCVDPDFLLPVFEYSTDKWAVFYDKDSAWGKANRPILLKQDKVTALILPFTEGDIVINTINELEQAEVAKVTK